MSQASMNLFMFYNGFPVFAIFQGKLEARKIAQSSLFTAKIITKYSSERFLCICGQKMSKGFLNPILL